MGFERDDDEPRPRRTFPELGLEPGGITDVRGRGHHEGVEAMPPHDFMGAGGAGLELLRAEASLWRVRDHPE